MTLELPVVPAGSVLDAVTGRVAIQRNNLLESLGTDLDDLRLIGDGEGIDSLLITACPLLPTIDTFDALASAGDGIKISSLDALATITGFNGIETISNVGGSAGSLEISSNANLTSVTGFQSLEAVNQALSIVDNPSLTSIAGLRNLATVGGSLILTNLPSLTDLSELESLTTVGDECEIDANLLDSAPQNVKDACALFTLDGDLVVFETQVRPRRPASTPRRIPRSRR